MATLTAVPAALTAEPTIDAEVRRPQRAPKLLLVDDDLRLATALRAALQRRGYDVVHARTVSEALSGHRYDVVLLDLCLPDGDGLELCRRLRSRSDAGIIVITDRGGPGTGSMV